MSEEVEDDGDGEGGKKKVGGKKLVLFILLPIVVLAGAGVGVYMSGLLDPLLGVEETAEEGGEAGEGASNEPVVATPGHYLDVREMIVSLRSSGRKQQILKLRISLELMQPEDQATIEAFMVRFYAARHRGAEANGIMMQAVPEADVVITNPTHFACALSYKPDTMEAPILVAKGQDLVAKRIRDLASEHDIPLIENPPLARALFAGCDLDQQIPEEHYKAVAEVISYVWRLKGQTVGG